MNCNKGQSHHDGLALVGYLRAHGGHVQRTNAEIAVDLGMVRNLGAGVSKVDIDRFLYARDHVRFGVDRGTGLPCCHYVLHYRAVAVGSQFALIDPTGALGPHVVAAYEATRGWAARVAQHKTECARQIETWQGLGRMALARGDQVGHRACQHASADLGRDGVVSSAAMAEVEGWLATLLLPSP